MKTFLAALAVVSLSMFTVQAQSEDQFDQASEEQVLAELHSSHPTLGRNVTTLRSLDKVLQRDDGSYELYSGEQLILVLAVDQEGTIVVKDSPTGFAPDMIEYTVDVENETQAEVEAFVFTFKECELDQSGETVQSESPMETCTILSAILHLDQAAPKGAQPAGGTKEYNVHGAGQPVD